MTRVEETVARTFEVEPDRELITEQGEFEKITSYYLNIVRINQPTRKPFIKKTIEIKEPIPWMNQSINNASRYTVKANAVVVMNLLQDDQGSVLFFTHGDGQDSLVAWELKREAEELTSYPI